MGVGTQVTLHWYRLAHVRHVRVVLDNWSLNGLLYGKYRPTQYFTREHTSYKTPISTDSEAKVCCSDLM